MTRPDGDVMLITLCRHRPVLLACEAIGWLHMVGKARLGFLRHHGKADVSDNAKHWHEALSPDWNTRLAWLQDAGGTLKWPENLASFLRDYDDGKSRQSVVGLLQAAHAMASGIEKQSYREETTEYLKQDVTHMWLSSPFGHPVRNLLADPPPLLEEGGWERLLERIGKLLNDLQQLGVTRSKDRGRWWTWREDAVGEGGWLREQLLSTLAETRLPNNDVTLWDQSYVAAALFKAAVAGVVLSGGAHWEGLKQRTRWRVLTVGLGARHYEARAVRVGDWAGARRDIDQFFTDVRKLIEVDLALGSLVYRDDEALAFTFPGLRDDAADGDARGSVDDTAAEALCASIQLQVDCLAKKLNLETPPRCRVSRSTRSFVRIVRELRELKADLAIPLHRSWSIGALAESGHVCPVCRVRFNGDGRGQPGENEKKHQACRVCGGRRRGRLDAWLAGEGDTIWISEVADGNDRVALLTLAFDLAPWIGGAHVDSLRAQSIAEWRRFNPVLNGHANPIDPDEPERSLISYTQSRLPVFDKDDPVLTSLQRGYGHANGWSDFYSKIVEDRVDAPRWEDLDNAGRARWLVHQLFRKLPSPGRIHRFWRTAEAFFSELMDEFRGIASVHPNRWRVRQLEFTAAEGSRQEGWEDGKTYAGRWGGGPLEVLYVADRGTFVTISNLARCFGPADTSEAIQGQTLELRGDDRIPRPLTVGAVGVSAGLGVYAPLLVLDRSPERCRLLVPLDRASACIERAVAKWQDEFARVWDRMPLRVGVVAFPRLTPFQAVIEAARNLEDALASARSETWRVVAAETRNGITALSLATTGSQPELVMVPTTLEDGRTDVFYPYLRVQDRQLRTERDFAHPDGQVYRHVADLRPGDGVIVDPGRFASVFLDTTARRFEPIEVRPLSDFRRMRETWSLLIGTAPSLTALRAAWDELERARSKWQDADGRWLDGAEAEWTALVRTVLREHLDAPDTALDTLVVAARDGVLARTIEWHLVLLKERLEA